MSKILVAIAVGALLAGPALAATEQTVKPSNTTSVPSIALTQKQVEASIATAGFKQFKGLQFKAGIWQAEARGGDVKWVDIYVHPLTGKLFHEGVPSPLNEQEIMAKVTAAGYRNVHDVDFKQGVWFGEADDSKGKDVALIIDPDDGSVINASND